MFFFGSHEDTARLYWDRAAASKGPAMPQGHYEEMKPKQLRIAITYARMAYSIAEQEQQPKEVMDILIEAYDLMFIAMVDADPSFVEMVKMNHHRYLGGHGKENVSKYRKLAGLES